MPLPPPAIPVFAGNPTTALMDGWIENTLGFQTTGILFRAERHASQSLSAGYNVIQFDTILEDPYGGWNASTYEWVAPYTGWYEVTLTCTVGVAAVTLAATVATPLMQARSSQIATGSAYPGIATGEFTVPLVGGISWAQGQTYVSAAATTNTTNGRYTTIEISFASQ